MAKQNLGTAANLCRWLAQVLVSHHAHGTKQLGIVRAPAKP